METVKLRKRAKEFWAGRRNSLERFRLFDSPEFMSGVDLPPALVAESPGCSPESTNDWEWIKVQEIKEKK